MFGVFSSSWHFSLSCFRWLLGLFWSSAISAAAKDRANPVRKLEDHRSCPLENVQVSVANPEDDGCRTIAHAPKEQSRLLEPSLDRTFHLARQGHDPTLYGRWSDIWKCTLKQNSQSCEVAVKSFRSRFLEEDNISKNNEKLRQELEVWARDKHENILPLLGVATGFGRFTALVYPWMENGTLTSYLQCNREILSLRDRLELLRDAAAGLCHLHSCSVVHGYLTGSNILVSASGKAKLSSPGLYNINIEFFGISYFPMIETVRWAATETLTTHDDESPAWIPTEQSDIYSFGSLMLQVCSGEVPYADLKSDAQVLLALSKGATPSRPLTPWMNDRIWHFIQRCWSTEEHGAKRPSAEEALKFIQEELSSQLYVHSSDRIPLKSEPQTAAVS
ncbi:hypothetical protein PAXINDRAFT_17119 [Paxillus involutus ATCC 200175]|uniref:Protein kinase domain-containing protein n=1 Tax=Paxillus involutus ATCC 200175 TaxID=664439 RepID=A0A0C9SQR0_PAXIN|nr:hypothetical protein PAXINDRAFT_17119 [Paxillus involutus ATCC 200175]